MKTSRAPTYALNYGKKTTMLPEEEEIALISLWQQNGDQKALLKLIQAFEPLVLKFARKYASYGIAKDELFAVGNLALCETAKRFEPERELKFSTYAGHWIRGTMLIFIASNYFSFTLKSQKMKHIFFTLRKQIHLEQKRGGGGLENTEQIMNTMAEQFGCSPQQLEQIYNLIRQPNVSMNEPVRQSDGEETTYGDTLCSADPSPEEAVIDRSMDEYRKQLIYTTMDRVLNDREKTIIKGQMLMEDDQERTLQDLADQFKLSRERVRQIRNNAYEKLERAIRSRCTHTDSRIFL